MEIQNTQECFVQLWQRLERTRRLLVMPQGLVPDIRFQKSAVITSLTTIMPSPMPRHVPG